MSVLDWILLAALVVVLPGLEIARGLRRRHADTPPRHKYRRTILVVSALMALLAVAWTTAGRPAALLGLEIPPTPRALALVGIAALILLALAAVVMLTARPAASADSGAGQNLLPGSARELRGFVLFAVAAGIGWELLSRGFLLWALEPWTGPVGAVAIASAAYGAGHGVSDKRNLAGSLAAALLFTTAYALTRSLWWLMLLHAGLPFLGLLAEKRLRASRERNPAAAG